MSRRSYYKTVESHGEEASCRGPSFEQPRGGKTYGEQHKKAVLVLASVVSGSIGKWGFRQSLRITSLNFVS